MILLTRSELRVRFRTDSAMTPFPNKIDCPAAFFNALQAENFRFCPFKEIGKAAGTKTRRE
jgi:hypothetical protein